MWNREACTSNVFTVLVDQGICKSVPVYLTPLCGGAFPGAGGQIKVSAIVTSYEIAMRDIKFLGRMKFKYLIVDEGHRLKNFESKLFRELGTLQLENKLLLTGGPRTC